MLVGGLLVVIVVVICRKLGILAMWGVSDWLFIFSYFLAIFESLLDINTYIFQNPINISKNNGKKISTFLLLAPIWPITRKRDRSDLA